MSIMTRWLEKHAIDSLIFLALATCYCSWLLGSVTDLGYARDEGFYFEAADSYLKWLKILNEAPAEAMTQSTVDRYWKVNHEHPALIKSLFALSRHWLYDELHWLPEPGTAYRFVGMALSCIAVGTTYLWGRAAHSRSAGLMAALLFAFIPRVFYHAHLDCFDMPVLAMWLITSYAYWRSLGRGPGTRSVGWAIVAGILYGLLLNTKHNSWLLPFALIAHVLLTESAHIVAGFRKWRLRAPLALWLMASIGPVLFFCTWPWIWFNTLDRLIEYVNFHTAHVYYNMEYLGQTYFEPPFPRGYAWLMTLATVPLICLLLGALGFAAFLRRTVCAHLKPWLTRCKSGFWSSFSEGTNDDSHHLWRTQVLWLLCIVISYAPWLSTGSPIFGGTKHWITAYPFICLFAGIGFVQCCAGLRRALVDSHRFTQLLPVEGLAAACVLVGPLSMTANSHPWGLSAYTPVVGGAPGAATLGLNRSFWGYSTGAIQDKINELAPKRGKVFIHDTAKASWNMLRKDGRIRKDLNGKLSPAWSKLAVYHHEQHMSRVEHQIWVDYKTVKPVHIGAHDGVPVVWLYQRPGKKKQP